MHYDIVIRNGTMIDGTGQPGVQADIGVRGDRIVAVGASLSGDAGQAIDATGRVVAPGFIDVHSHDDFALLDRPLCDFKILQGVTTEVIGNCGFGAAPANDAYRNFLRSFGPLLFGPMGDFFVGDNGRVLSCARIPTGFRQCGLSHSSRSRSVRSAI